MAISCAGSVVKTHNKIVSDFRSLAEPAKRGEKLPMLLDRARRRVGFAYSRAFEIWYGRAKVTVEEKEAIAAAIDAKRQQEARNEFYELKARMARLESLLVQTDADFHRETVGVLRDAVRGRG